ncbi:phage tail protein [Pseudomonas fragi]|uniref:phage tail protein n=1 Tax=Pseudomonas fragi TaxID=296 RepID=UPI001F22FFDE|nr:phage tail protein [Pseudomonas fragi]MCF6763837.1 phage tail protein [Pseudomonas fragi]
MTTTADLRRLTMEALVGATEAGDRVFAARSWPIAKGDYPLLYLHSPAEDMDSLGRNGAPQFTVTAVIRISARIQLKHMAGNAAAAKSVDELETIQQQIKRAVINYPPLMARLQQFSFIRSQIQEDGEGQLELAELVMDIGMEFYQGPEEFYPIPLIQT